MRYRTMWIIWLAIVAVGVGSVLAVREAKLRSSTANDVVRAVSRARLRRLERILSRRPELVNAKKRNGWTPLQEACKQGNEQVLAFLISKGADVNAKLNDGRTGVFIAVHNKREGNVKVLLANGADVNARDNEGRTALHMAPQRDYLPAIDVLLAGGADVNAKDNEGRTPLDISLEHGNRTISDLLRRHGAVATRTEGD